MIVRMWEVAAHPEAHQDLLSWICDVAVTELEADLGHMATEVFTSPDQRIVVVSRWRGQPRDLPAPPSYLVRSGPQRADFSPVDR